MFIFILFLLLVGCFSISQDEICVSKVNGGLEKLHNSILSRDINATKRLLDEGVDPNGQINGKSPAILAGCTGNVDTLKELVSRDADLRGALHGALYFEEDYALKYLLSKKLETINVPLKITIGKESVNFNDKNGVPMTPLMLSCASLKDSHLELMLEKIGEMEEKLKGDPLGSLIIERYPDNIFLTKVRNRKEEKRVLKMASKLVKAGLKVQNSHFVACGRYGNIEIFRALIDERAMEKSKELKKLFALTCEEAVKGGNLRMFVGWREVEKRSLGGNDFFIEKLKETYKEIFPPLRQNHKKSFISYLELEYLELYKLIEHSLKNEDHIFALDRVIRKMGGEDKENIQMEEGRKFISYLINIADLNKNMGCEAKEKNISFFLSLTNSNEKYKCEDLKKGLIHLMATNGCLQGLEAVISKVEKYTLEQEWGEGFDGKWIRKLSMGYLGKEDREGCFHKKSLREKKGPFTMDLEEALLAAVSSGNSRVVLAIAKGVGGVDKIIVDRLNVLMLCASSDKVDLMDLSLLEWGYYKKGDRCQDCMNFLLNNAAFHNRAEMIHFLISKGAEVNNNSSRGTPLHYAIRKSSKEAIEVLLEMGADLEFKSINGESGFEHALKLLDYPSLEVMMKGCILKERGMEVMYEGIKVGNEKIVEILIGKGLIINEASKIELFTLSVNHGHEGVAKLISFEGKDSTFFEKYKDFSLYQSLTEEGYFNYAEIIEKSVKNGNRKFSLKLLAPKLRFKKQFQQSKQISKGTFYWDRVYGAQGYEIRVKKIKGSMASSLVEETEIASTNIKSDYVINKTLGPNVLKYIANLEKGIYEIHLRALSSREKDSTSSKIMLSVDNRPNIPNIKSVAPVLKKREIISIIIEWDREANVDEYILNIKGMNKDGKVEHEIFKYLWGGESRTSIEEPRVLEAHNFQVSLISKITWEDTSFVKSIPAVKEISFEDIFDNNEKIKEILLKKLGRELGNNPEHIYYAVDFMESKNFNLENIFRVDSSFLLSILSQQTGRDLSINVENVKFSFLTLFREIDAKIDAINNFTSLAMDKLYLFLKENRSFFDKKGGGEGIENIEKFFSNFYYGKRAEEVEENTEATIQSHRRKGLNESALRVSRKQKEKEIKRKMDRVLYLLLFKEKLDGSDKSNILSLISSATNCSAEYNGLLLQAWESTIEKIYGKQFNGLDEFIAKAIYEIVSNLKQNIIISLKGDRQTTHTMEYISLLMKERYGFPMDNEVSSEYNEIIAESIANRQAIIEKIDATFGLKEFSNNILNKFDESKEAKSLLIDYLDLKLPKPFNYFNGLFFYEGKKVAEVPGIEGIKIEVEVMEALLLEKGIAKLNER